MKTEIKKINSLEELNKLEIGEVIQSSDNGKIVSLLYEGVDKNFDEMTNFLEVPNLNNYKILFERSYDRKKIKFNEGLITSSIYFPFFYRVNDKKNQEKLNLIKRTIK